ncbi:type III effector protein [Streptomyces sp. NPDC051784]|uniref:type III effector protein n=1 Tax=Streptomyces sp. NPDC051784 TaxID=3155805 RepID=UPI00341364D2
MNPPPSQDHPPETAIAAALDRIAEVMSQTGTPPHGHPADQPLAAGQAVAALRLLHELRDQLAAWEPGLIEAARAAGASWADLAQPLGVSSRQAAEKRYLRVRPGAPGATGAQRVEATRSGRAADRSVTSWARSNAAELRQLAGQITALTGLPSSPATELSAALAHDDAARLVAPLAEARDHLAADHPDLAARIDTMSRRTEQLRQDSNDRRGAL